MGIKLTGNEKKLAVATICAVILYFYFYSVLDPAINRAVAMNREIASLKRQIALINLERAYNRGSVRPADLFPSKEQQMSRLLSFIEERFASNSIRIESLQQASSDGILLLDLRFTGTYGNVRSFLSSLKDSPAIISISEVSMSQTDSGISASVKITAPFK